MEDILKVDTILKEKKQTLSKLYMEIKDTDHHIYDKLLKIEKLI